MKTQFRKDLRRLLPCAAALALFVLALCLCSGRFSAEESSPLTGKCGENVTWTLDDDGVLTISGDGKMDSYGWGYGVSADHLNPWVYAKIKPKILILQDGITHIGTSAFWSLGSLTSITIPASVTSIGDNAFDCCAESLQSIVVDPNNPVYSGKGSCLIDTRNGELLLGSAKSVIPDDGSVLKIGSYAFYNCKVLTSLTIPESVSSIEAGAFSGCAYSLQSIKVNPNNPVYFDKGNCLIEKESSTLVLGTAKSEIPADGSVTKIGDAAFRDCVDLAALNVPEGITEIGKEAFYNCTGIAVATIPKSLERIESSAFFQCTALSSVDISCNVDDSAFSGCSGLHSVAFSDDVKSIGFFAFKDCINLQEITVPAGVTYLDSAAFSGCIGLQSLKVDPDNPEYFSEGNCIIDRNSYLTNLDTGEIWEGAFVTLGCGASVIPDDKGIIAISNNAFWGFTNLTSVQIPEGVVFVGIHAFFDCPALKEIHFPRTFTSLYGSANDLFPGCTGLNSITVDPNNQTYLGAGNCLIEKETGGLVLGCSTSEIPNDGSVKEIQSTAFQNCIRLIKITIPEGVTTIHWDAFYGCSGLEEVYLPRSITKIGSSAFYDCKSLRAAYYPGTQDEWNEKVTVDYSNEALTDVLVFNWRPKTEAVPGDLDGDGALTATDRTTLARALAGWEGYAVDPDLADVNRDGEVTAADRTYLARYLAGWEGYTLG